MPRIFDENGKQLGALPPDAVRVNSSLTMLTGKYVDGDGIIYDPDGTINEAATAAYAREIAMRVTAGADFWHDPYQVKQDSIQEQSAQDASYAYWDSQFDNYTTTAGEIPGRVADATKSVFNIFQWLVVGAVVLIAFQHSQSIPATKRRIIRVGKRKVREYRQQVGRYVAGR